MNLWIVVLMALIPLASVLADEPRPIYDGRLTLHSGRVSAADLALLERDVHQAALRIWRGTDACHDEFQVLDAATGAFTRPGVVQKAFLYRYCITGHALGKDGIAIVEGDHLMAHVAFDGGADNAIGALPDINGDGLSEIILAGGGTGQGLTIGSISILEIGPNDIIRFGRTQTYEDDCGTGNDPGRTEAHRLYVQPGPDPHFFYETFIRKGCGSDTHWTKVKPRVAFSLEAEERSFLRLK